MNLIDNLRSIFIPAKTVDNVVIKKAPMMSQRMDVLELPEPPEKKTTDYLEAMRGWVYIAVKAIAQEVAKIDLVLYRKRGGKVTIVENHEMLDILDRINPFTTKNDFIEATQAYMELCGEAFWWKYKVGKVKQLWMLRPDFINILPPKGDSEYIGGYEYKITGMKEAINYGTDEVVHFKTFNPTNPYRGMSALRAADYAYDTDLFASKWNRNFFYNNAMPATILTTEQSIKPKDINRIRTEWENSFGGVNKAHKMAIMTGGLKVDDVLKQSIKDMDFLNLRKFSRDEIFTIFQVPPTIIGITEDVNRANAAEGKAVWLDNVIKPKMSKFVAFLNEFFAPEWGEEYYFGFKDPSPTNLKMNLDILTKAGSILSLNEKRDLIEYDPVDGGDEVMVYDPNQDNSNNDDKKDDKKPIKSLTAKRPAKKNINIVVHKTTTADILRRKILSLIKRKGVDKTLKEMLYITMNNGKDDRVTVKSGKKKDDTEELGVIGKEKREGFWKSMVARSEVQEVEFAKKINEYWKGQEKRVIFKLSVGMPKDVESYIYETDAENRVFVEFIESLMQKIIAQAGNEAMQLLGLTEDFRFIEEVLDEIKRYNLVLADSINTTTKNALKEALMSGISNHESIPQLAGRVSGVYTEASKARATSIARTETIRANNYGSVEAYKQSGVVEMKEWMAALDERTCQFCLAMELEYNRVGIDDNFLNKGDELIGLDGGVLQVSYDNLKAPPIHPMCRCTVLPVIKLNSKSIIDEKNKISDLKIVKENALKEATDALDEKDKVKDEIKAYKVKKMTEVDIKAKEILKTKELEAKAKKSKIIKEAKLIRSEVRKKLYE